MRSSLLALILLLLAPLALADSEARQGADWVRVTAQPCADPAVVALIQQDGEDHADWRAASAEFQGQAFAACWKPMFAQRVVYLRYSDGDGGMIPFDALKPLKEV